MQNDRPTQAELDLMLKGVCNASSKPDWRVAERETMSWRETKELQELSLGSSRKYAPPSAPAESPTALDVSVSRGELEYLQAAYFGKGPVIA